MSPLTKLFVVLLVLVSIVLSAGVVTFVNRLDPLQKTLAAQKAQLAQDQATLNQKASDYAAGYAALDTQRQQTAAERDALRNQLLGIRANLEDRDAQIAKLNSTVASLTSANMTSSAALNASEDSKGKMGEMIVALRADADTRLRQTADLGERVDKLVAELERTEQERRNLAEQLTEASTKTGRLSQMLQDMGVAKAQIDNGPAGVAAGAPAINGIIRSRRTIAGKEYATISIGSSDQVIKGMEFKILDKDSGQFLGMLQVDVVDPTEAVGQIIAEPEKIAQIRAGNVVKTQI